MKKDWKYIMQVYRIKKSIILSIISLFISSVVIAEQENTSPSEVETIFIIKKLYSGQYCKYCTPLIEKIEVDGSVLKTLHASGFVSEIDFKDGIIIELEDNDRGDKGGSANCKNGKNMIGWMNMICKKGECITYTKPDGTVKTVDKDIESFCPSNDGRVRRLQLAKGYKHLIELHGGEVTLLDPDAIMDSFQ